MSLPEMAAALGDLAVLCEERGLLADAEAHSRRALDLRENSLPDGHPDVIVALESLARILYARGLLRLCRAPLQTRPGLARLCSASTMST